MKKIIMAILPIFISQVAMADVFYKVKYIGGAPNVEANKEWGSLDIGNDTITFWTGKPDKSKKLFEFSTQAVSDMATGKRAKRRIGSGVTWTLLAGPIGLAAWLTKKKTDVILIEYKDKVKKEGGAPVFVVRRDNAPMIKMALEAKTGKVFEDKELYDETKKGQRKDN